ncbi:Rossmann-fold NAD(P)-binding domain-containing protein [Pedobacter nyackensis]|uniref:FAD dependent oxidoreductase n=1 Tax=Pedobacter nyackensis TaxID=475255 RepID=A0A1W2BPI8_9SPHI|nr:hypothetical protein [Pedobacter nyackensis]SMC74889.1 hypothetical protein SAMN04488101_102693 [Pedobacter nyackensis]
MKKGLFIVFIISVFTQIAVAQTLKTGVLVIGNGNNAVGAGFQSALSGVKTIMLIQQSDLTISPPEKNISSGIEAGFLKRMRVAKGMQDSTAKVYVDGTSANAVLKTWADTIKNLTILRNVKWARIKRSGRNWNVQLADGRTIKAEVLVNADGTGIVNEVLELPAQTNKLWQALSYADNLYRLSVTSGYSLDGTTANIIPFYSFLLPKQENLVVLNPKQESMAGGQAGGAVAAYAVFFKTKTSLGDLKLIQKELIAFKLAVMPFADIQANDPNWKAIQRVGLTGFLKAAIVNGEASFSPESEVTIAEIKVPLKEFYYKAQIWFDDHKEPNMTLGSLISMICMVGNKAPENTKKEIEKKWASTYQFKNKFDLNRNVTRREFSALVDGYLDLIEVNLDRTGRVIR